MIGCHSAIVAILLYFSTTTASALSGRQRTAASCEGSKRRNRKTAFRYPMHSVFIIIGTVRSLSCLLHSHLHLVPTHFTLIFSQNSKFVQLFSARNTRSAGPSSLNSHQIFEDCPIEHMIMIETLAYEESAEDFVQIGILRFVVKAMRMNMIEISHKFL